MNLWTNPIQVIADWLMQIFTGWGLAETLASVLIDLIGIVFLVVFILILDVMLVWVERKVVARFQDRLGPNRVGPFGLIQPFADIIKLFIKEDITPEGADKVIYNIAPVLSVSSVLILWAIFPLAPVIIGVDLNVGVLYLVAAGALGTLSIIMAGWASNNKFALLGAFRQVAAMISYEIPMIVVLLIPTIFAGSMGMLGISEGQQGFWPWNWYVFLSPLGALIFLISAIAELGRAPFDLSEGESEVVAGFHIEYSGMKFGWFYAGELLHAFTFGGFWAILFFGGYNFFGLEKLGPLVSAAIVLFKAMVGYWVIMWIKYTLMRIRIDHMLAFNWKFLVPLSFVVLMVTALLNTLLRDAPTATFILSMFFSNVIIAGITIEILRRRSRSGREKVEGQASSGVKAT
ncbi:MAG: NADH-quinone oxidoreductase subunit H [Anaerolineae bacterium]|nr:NADH-quinone oxidoreductase subunit H [Anaerolineae bacterium]MDK1080747.1 NADH-quinone oxidoreductase subunit H [Anaerolineae bacterium]MDK1118072.1 NADH-quinone oxidoreductase subunit H [Anaerolineae bacterium]